MSTITTMPSILQRMLSSKKVRIAIGIVVSALLVLMIYNKVTTAVLTISATPEGATITVDESITAINNFRARLPKGRHTVKVSLDNHETQESEINLQKDEKSDYSLIATVISVDTKVETISRISDFGAVDATTVSDDTLLYLDVKTAHLKKVVGGVPSEIYSQPVRLYSFEFPWVALIEKNDSSKIVLIDIRNNKVTAHQAKNLDPIIWVSVSEDLQSIHFLANYNPASRQTKLFVSPISSFAPKEILSTTSNEVVGLSRDHTFLYQFVEAADASFISIFDINTKQAIYKQKADRYSFSESKKYLVLQSSNVLSILDLEKMSKTDIKMPELVKTAWINDDVLLITKNTNPGVQLQYLSLVQTKTLPHFKIEALDNKTLLSLVGVIGQVLYALDIDGKLLRIELPSIDF